MCPRSLLLNSLACLARRSFNNHFLTGPPGTDGLSTIWPKYATLRCCTVGHNAVGAGADVPEHHSNRLTFHCGRRIAQDAPADGATGPVDADASPAP